jgi:hypothetical protein
VTLYSSPSKCINQIGNKVELPLLLTAFTGLSCLLGALFCLFYAYLMWFRYVNKPAAGKLKIICSLYSDDGEVGLVVIRNKYGFWLTLPPLKKKQDV